MKISPRPHQKSTTTTTAAAAANGLQPPPPPSPTTRITNRSESANPYPATFVQADTSSFKEVVQMLTGSPETAKQISTPKTHIPPIKSIPKRQHSTFKLYERRNLLNNFQISPVFASLTAGFSPRNYPEILSPTMLDFPSLLLSPVTPLIPDPFRRSQPLNCEPSNNITINPPVDEQAEAKAIREKGFYLHPSPATTPRESEPQLLPLFPVTSPADQPAPPRSSAS
ncbi:VQ motif-containing protein 4-like [Cucurbita moschata]|uniref:VQ motif-containing protein 4-like n=1 Tax=Cucurbita moschata TaxID=3662 RepID=A0A6J1EM47_CUCMO|nr:VQ motif-containing protein 4-like [Cucurbita moschata]